MGHHLSTQFPDLFKKETYAVRLALAEEGQLKNQFEDILASKPIEGVYDKEYEFVPFGELEGREESEPIPQVTASMGWTSYGAIATEMSGKFGLSKILKGRAREFVSPGGSVDEPRFAGYLADTVSRSFTVRAAQKRRKLCAKIFNRGGIQAGDSFFNMYDRCNMSDVTNSNLIYDGMPLFARPASSHVSYASSATTGSGSAAVSNYIDYGKSIANTGGYFNAFDFPPSYWALKLVYTHWKFNMQYDENDERYDDQPDTLLVSSYNELLWKEILKSKFVEPQVSGQFTNVENVFQFEGVTLRLVVSSDLIRNTWFLGKARAPGIILLKPSSIDDPWAYFRDENNRSYWITFEEEWGFMIRNWRHWCAGAISTDGSTAPTFGSAHEADWHIEPDGI